ncbi:hypothetical protein A1Q1_01893 [Trichosporon asahii var. asahii CBS 2479]|uniref:Uncharacterized protein n=1 Tax=Trichosporon asahii var. asahii (strain ATCC 90039 / CBS 2479 / JCM 2466 / KCTC 7840 / NBRC 103889/ NCYC 2677 / UAMH 7654) TaxID=1186058 RepID=J6F1G5_TRIAS|nr:hypothetical protein A1Q1_01893 [Trichosporon asahii var. asahii CBS 2479]EJT48982.1 hypothetical protein A1Q1_01893 [Trichosporon asahii var. asahii CBS 2479]
MDPTRQMLPPSTPQGRELSARTSSTPFNATPREMTPNPTPSRTQNVPHTRSIGPPLVEGRDWWKPSGPHWLTDATKYSKCSAELLLELLEEDPDLWQGWKAGRHSGGAQRRKDANNKIIQRLYERKAPVMKTAGALNNYLAKIFGKWHDAWRMERPSTGDGWPAEILCPDKVKRRFLDPDELSRYQEKICRDYQRLSAIMEESGGAPPDTITDSYGAGPSNPTSDALMTQMAAPSQPSYMYSDDEQDDETQEPETQDIVQVMTEEPTLRTKNLDANPREYHVLSLVHQGRPGQGSREY